MDLLGIGKGMGRGGEVDLFEGGEGGGDIDREARW